MRRNARGRFSRNGKAARRRMPPWPKSGGEAPRRRRGRRRRRYAAAMENPLSGMELAITLFTGSLGFGAAEVVDRFMALRKNAPFAGTAAATLVPIYSDWPRLVVAAGMTAVPLVIGQVFIKNAAGRSALQTFAIGAGLRTIGNVIVNVAARLSKSTQTGQRLFPLELQAQEAVRVRNQEVKKIEAGTAGTPPGLGAPAECPTCKQTTGLGACCPPALKDAAERVRDEALRQQQMQRQQQQQMEPPPPPAIPPMIPRPQVPEQPPVEQPQLPAPRIPTTQFTPTGTTTTPGPAVPAQPPSAAIPGGSMFAPPAARPPAGLPNGVGRPPPNYNWGSPDE